MARLMTVADIEARMIGSGIESFDSGKPRALQRTLDQQQHPAGDDGTRTGGGR